MRTTPSMVTLLVCLLGASAAWSQTLLGCNGRAGASLSRCLEQQRTKASEAVVAKTKEWMTLSMLSCPHNVYVEWQDSLKPLAALWDYASTSGAQHAPMARAIEVEIMESRFAVADAALRNGGRFCRKYADAEYRQILQSYRDPAFAFARDRARVGIDDVRALPKIED